MSDASTSATSPNWSALPDHALKVIINPAGFFREMPRRGGWLEPIVFLAAMGLVNAVLVMLLVMIGFAGVVAASGMAAGAIGLIIAPIIMPAVGFIGAAIAFIIWKFLGSNENYETAYRCLAYAGAIVPIMTLLSLVPYLGAVVSVVWLVYLLILASVHVHNLPLKRAAIAFGVLGIALLVLNLRSEYEMRQFSAPMQTLSESMQETMGDAQDMTPEQMGKVFGEFMRGVEQTQKDTGSSATDNDNGVDVP